MSQDNQVVNPDPTNQNQSELAQTQPQVVAGTTQTVQPGDKTDSALLLKSLQEEREKRRLAEEEARLLKEQINTPTPSDEVFSDEGKALKTEIQSTRQEIEKLKEERELEKVYTQFPDLKGLSGEFEAYKADFPRHKLENVAKLFLTEKGLMDAPRKGLEQTTGGTRTPLTSGMTAEDVRHLRTTNYKKYQDMLMKGQIKIE